MITPARWLTTLRRPLTVLAGCVVVGLAGCAAERDHRLAQLSTRDPLKGDRIPPPNVPTGRDQYGAKDGRDPLLRADAGGRGGIDLASHDGANEPLRIPDRRPGAVATSASRELTLGSSATAEQLQSDLQNIGAKLYGPTRTETGSYEVRVVIPNGVSGATSGFTGGGATPTAALRDAYEQVRSVWR
ncbi:MAG: hypothetical protein MUF18_18405 [Fimbriiglobus sp.]|jgi:hypothetical protein|nr:hypothetical protein [Fimbriiglobus sp.]